MGREIRRVPLDFVWPIGKVWEGFFNPFYTSAPCATCDGDGMSPEARRLRDLWYGYTDFYPEDRGSVPFAPDCYAIRSLARSNVERSPEYYGSVRQWVVDAEARRLCAHFNGSWSHHLNQDDVDALVEAGRLYGFTHEFKAGEGWAPKPWAPHPTAQEVNEWSLQGFGHDSINQWIVCKAECARHGWATECTACGGHGDVWPSEEAKDTYEAWQKTGPPIGEGWQMWETVSEGSPVTPVFATADELVWHLVIEHGHSESGARAFVNSGWAPSMIGTSEGLMSGIEWMGKIAEEEDGGGWRDS
jgi:hypothetical protein